MRLSNVSRTLVTAALRRRVERMTNDYRLSTIDYCPLFPVCSTAFCNSTMSALTGDEPSSQRQK